MVQSSLTLVLSTMAMKRLGKKEDDRMFSMSSTKIASQTYKQIYDPEIGVALNSKQILEDIGGVYTVFDIVSEAKGVYVHGLAQTTGRRLSIRGSGEVRERQGVLPLNTWWM